MDKKEAKRFILDTINYRFPEAKEELARIRKINDLQERCKEAKCSHENHSTRSSLTSSY
jgi:hypothetical protein